jgi:hypothetical protein
MKLQQSPCDTCATRDTRFFRCALITGEEQAGIDPLRTVVYQRRSLRTTAEQRHFSVAGRLLVGWASVTSVTSVARILCSINPVPPQAMVAVVTHRGNINNIRRG